MGSTDGGDEGAHARSTGARPPFIGEVHMNSAPIGTITMFGSYIGCVLFDAIALRFSLVSEDCSMNKLRRFVLV
jgi:hypothetical protein